LSCSFFFFFFSSRRRHTRSLCDWSSDVCSSDLDVVDADHAEIEVAEVIGTPAGYPNHFGDFDLSVIRIDDVSNKGKPHPLATWRSEERRVGKECRCRGATYNRDKKKIRVEVSAH